MGNVGVKPDTLADGAINAQTLVTPTGDDEVLIGDASDSNNLKKVTAGSLANLNNGGRNDIINGGLVVNQENQTAPADDEYTIGDLFLHVGEGTPVMSLETDGPQGTRPWQKMVLDANAQGGLVYFMSNADVQDYIADGALSFGVQLRTVTGALIDNARIGILKWNSTADTITSDVVATWASDGTDPTLATNWSYENTPANLALTDAWQRFTVENVTVDSDATNLAVFIWTDDGIITASDVIGFSEWQCNPGATVNDFSQPDEATIRQQIYPYIERQLFDGQGNEMIHPGYQSSTTVSQIDMRWLHRSRTATPTITHTAASTFSLSSYTGLYAASAVAAFNNGGRFSDRFGMTHATGGAAGIGTTLTRTGTQTCWIQRDDRL